MTKLKLDIPKNSRFKSSLNEHDMILREILIHNMRIADPRNKTALPDSQADENKGDYLWDKTRVFQVDDMTTEDIFDTYLLRKEINKLPGTDVTYPLLAYKEENIDTVFWGTGNRSHQHYLETDVNTNTWEVGDEVAILSPIKYRGYKGNINSIEKDGFIIRMGQDIIYDTIGTKLVPHAFSSNDLRMLNEKKIVSTFKAKAITTKYSCVVLADNRDEIQYIRDHYMLRVADHHVWYEYESPIINNSINNIFTVFGIPNIDRYPTASDKLKNTGYIYGTSFVVDTWAVLTDTPLPAGFIDNIRMSLTVEPDGRGSRIIIDGNQN